MTSGFLSEAGSPAYAMSLGSLIGCCDRRRKVEPLYADDGPKADQHREAQDPDWVDHRLSPKLKKLDEESGGPKKPRGTIQDPDVFEGLKG